MDNKDMPAMPIFNDHGMPGNAEIVIDHPCGTIGLTKLEHFAGLAMQGVASNRALIDGVNEDISEWVATESVRLAKALLSELEKKDG